MRKKSKVILQITDECDLECAYCYHKSVHHKKKKYKYISLNDAAFFIEKICGQLQLIDVILIGGEPLLHPELEKIIRLLVDKNIRVTLWTNGYLLDKENIMRLKSAGLWSVIVNCNTLDISISSKLINEYNLIKLKNNILNVVESGLTLHLATILTSINLTGFTEVLKLGFSFGAVTHILFRYIEPPDSGKSGEVFKADNNTLARFLSIADKFAGETGYRIESACPIEDCEISHSKYRNIFFGKCHNSGDQWFISPDGKVKICEFNNFILGNVFDSNFYQMQESFLFDKFRMMNKFVYCPVCDEYQHCGGGCRYITKADIKLDTYLNSAKKFKSL